MMSRRKRLRSVWEIPIKSFPTKVKRLVTFDGLCYPIRVSASPALRLCLDVFSVNPVVRAWVLRLVRWHCPCFWAVPITTNRRLCNGRSCLSGEISLVIRLSLRTDRHSPSSFHESSTRRFPSSAWFSKFDHLAPTLPCHKFRWELNSMLASRPQASARPSSIDVVWSDRLKCACKAAELTFSEWDFHNLEKRNFEVFARISYLGSHTRTHKERNPEPARQNSITQRLQRRAIKRQCSTNQHIENNSQRLRKECNEFQVTFNERRVVHLTQISISGPVYFFPSNTSGAA